MKRNAENIFSVCISSASEKGKQETVLNIKNIELDERTSRSTSKLAVEFIEIHQREFPAFVGNNAEQ